MGDLRPSEAEVSVLSNYIQVSTDINPYIYSRNADRLLTGTQQNPPHDEVIISGLGSATKTAVGVAAIVTRDTSARIKKITTEIFESDKMKRQLPKITIIVSKK